MRRALTLLATVAILIGLVAAPASADKPTEYRWDLYFDADNPGLPLNDPCTGLDMGYIDVYLIIREHQGHKNNLIAITKGYGTTGSGYELSGSPDHVMIKGDLANPDLVVSGFSDMWTNPENGNKMHMKSVFVLKKGDTPDTPVIQVDKLEATCVGGPTIDPLP
jgi:hypothetical protein